jgi:hypothetical protein
MGGNWLDPQSGSFLSFDPLGHFASDSGYSFSRGNPLALSFWDADGRGKNPALNQSLSERIQSRAHLTAWEAAATAQTCMDCHSRLDVLMAGYMPYDQPWYNQGGVNAVGVRTVGGMKVAAGTVGIIVGSTASSTGIGGALGGPVLLGSAALIKSGGTDIKTGSFSTLVADDMVARGSSPQDAAEMEVLLSAVLLADGMAVKPTSVNAASPRQQLLLAGPSQGRLNAVRGNAFHDEVYNALRLRENTTKVTGNVRGKPVNTEPDLLGVRTGVTDIKDEISLSFDTQLRAQYDYAVQNSQTFNLIISPRTETISRPLQQAVSQQGGIIVEFNPVTGSFRAVRVQGNRIVR